MAIIVNSDSPAAFNSAESARDAGFDYGTLFEDDYGDVCILADGRDGPVMISFFDGVPSVGCCLNYPIRLTTKTVTIANT